MCLFSFNVLELGKVLQLRAPPPSISSIVRLASLYLTHLSFFYPFCRFRHSRETSAAAFNQHPLPFDIKPHFNLLHNSDPSTFYHQYNEIFTSLFPNLLFHSLEILSVILISVSSISLQPQDLSTISSRYLVNQSVHPSSLPLRIKIYQPLHTNAE